jgi:hypothetical protein
MAQYSSREPIGAVALGFSIFEIKKRKTAKRVAVFPKPDQVD